VDADLKRALALHPCFSALSEEQLHALQPGLGVVRLDEGEHLFRQGQQAERFFYVHSGQIKLYRLSPSGNEKVIEIVRPGETFAEAVMFMSRPDYPVSAEALSATLVVTVENRLFLGILRQSVDTCFRLMSNMSVRLRERIHEIDSLTLQNATLRLVNYLLYRLREDGDSDQICLPAAKHIIASHLSIQPETLSRILSSLSSKGLISVKGLMITVHDMDGLRDLAS